MEGSQLATIPLACAEVSTREVTLVLCDVADFTRFTEQLGDAASYHVVKQCEALTLSVAREFGGELLEIRGDGFLIAFETPLAAAGCAVAIQREIKLSTQLPIRMRVGLHTGSAIHDGGRYFGRTVITAFRVSNLARADQILVTDETRRRLPETTFSFRPCREVWLKGFGRPHRVWEMNWRAAREVDRSHLGTGGPSLRASRPPALALAPDATVSRPSAPAARAG